MTIKWIAELYNVTVKRVQEIVDKSWIKFTLFSQQVAWKEYTTEVYWDKDIEIIGLELNSIKDIKLSDFNKKLKQGLDFNPRK